MEGRIPVFKPAFGEEEKQALCQTLDSGWVGRGPRTVEFEERFAEFIGVKNAIALNSATAALHLSMLATGVEGQEVLTTSMTFVSTNHSILHGGGRPVFCDIEPHTLNINPEEVRKKITPTTRAIVVVHYGGHACDMDPILDLARDNGLWVIEDVAHGCGGLYKGRKLGSLGDIGCFSFQATKNLTTGEGGMLTTDDDELAERIRKLRWVGISRPTWERFQPGLFHSWMYEVEELGFKYEMNDLGAALGLVQLEKLQRTNAERRRLLARYRAAFADVDGVEMLGEEDYADSSCHNAVIKVAADRRDLLYAHLHQRGIDSNVHYHPNHMFPLYKLFTTRLQVTEREWERILTIPLFPDLAEIEQDRVIEAVREFMAGSAEEGQRAAAQA